MDPLKNRAKRTAVYVLIIVFWFIVGSLKFPPFDRYVDTLIIEVLFYPALNPRIRGFMNLSTFARIFYTTYVYWDAIGGSLEAWANQDPGTALFIYSVTICLAVLVQRWALIRTFRSIGFYSRLEKILGIDSNY